MKFFLAGTVAADYYFPHQTEKCDYILESFLVLKNKPFPEYMKNCEMFLLDSGAFTFQSGVGKKSVDWDEYLNDYIKFIKENDIDYFFELDIDVLVGYDKVKEFRKKLNDETGKQCIPVWHYERGIEDFKEMCRQYSYVAIGASGKKGTQWTRTQPKFTKALIMEAHKHNCQMHGLGFTNLKLLKNLPFDSVDSTSWLSGVKYGTSFTFDGKSLVRRYRKSNERMIDNKAISERNFVEWCKFQKYMKGRELL